MIRCNSAGPIPDKSDFRGSGLPNPSNGKWGISIGTILGVMLARAGMPGGEEARRRGGWEARRLGSEEARRLGCYEAGKLGRWKTGRHKDIEAYLPW